MMQENIVLPNFYVKCLEANSHSESNIHSTIQRDSTYAGTISSMSDMCTLAEIEDVEFTDKDLELIEQAEQILMRQKTRKLQHERELVVIRNQMDRVMNLNHPIEMKTKLMESLNERLQTRLNCINEDTIDFKEKIIRLERLNSYMTTFKILESFKKDNGFTNIQSDSLARSIDEILTIAPSINSIASINDVSSKMAIPDEDNNHQEVLQEEASNNSKIESIIVLLKQIVIPLAISIENTKDDHDDMQNVVKAKKKSFEEKLKLVEDVKKQISINDIQSYNKENINPQTNKGSSKKVKLHDLYMDYGEKSMEMSLSRINMSTTNTSIFQDASSKVSKMFGKIFKNKKTKVPENILTSDVLQDLGLQISPQRAGGLKV